MYLCPVPLTVRGILDLSLTTTSGRPTSSTVRGAAGGFCGRLYGMICPRRGCRRAPPPRPTADRRSVSAPVEAVASLEADLDALRRDVASLRPRQQASRPTWLLFAAAGLALTAWVLTPSEDPYALALTS